MDELVGIGCWCVLFLVGFWEGMLLKNTWKSRKKLVLMGVAELVRTNGGSFFDLTHLFVCVLFVLVNFHGQKKRFR